MSSAFSPGARPSPTCPSFRRDEVAVLASEASTSYSPSGVGWTEINPDGEQSVPFALKFCQVVSVPPRPPHLSLPRDFIPPWREPPRRPRPPPLPAGPASRAERHHQRPPPAPPQANKGKLLAVADEEGYVAILNTAREIPETTWPQPGADPSRPQCSAFWRAHENAVFDLAWVDRDQRLISASGDHSLRWWDTRRALCLAEGVGHHGSVKCVDAMPGHDHIAASGGRDGVVALWDSRLQGSPHRGLAWPASLPVATVPAAHLPPGSKAPRVTSPRAAGARRAAASPSPAAVTALQFLTDPWLLATGGTDGSVKIWDTRHLYAPLEAEFRRVADPSRAPAPRGRGKRGRAGAPRGGPGPEPLARPFGAPSGVSNFKRGEEPAFAPRARGTAAVPGEGSARDLRRAAAAAAAAGAGEARPAAAGPGPGSAGDEERRGYAEAMRDVLRGGLGTTKKMQIMHILAVKAAPVGTLAPGGDPHGVTGIAVSPTGGGLAVSYAKESTVRLFDPRRPSLGAIAGFEGHRADSFRAFYIKLDFSPCGRWLLAGSSDHLARVYRVSAPREPPVALQGHAGEVCAVSWCRAAGPPQLATASDDGTVRVWAPRPSRVPRLSRAVAPAGGRAGTDERAGGRAGTDDPMSPPPPGGRAAEAGPAGGEPPEPGTPGAPPRWGPESFTTPAPAGGAGAGGGPGTVAFGGAGPRGPGAGAEEVTPATSVVKTRQSTLETFFTPGVARGTGVARAAGEGGAGGKAR